MSELGTTVAGAIDCDIHPHFREGIEDLEPYIDSQAWKHRMGLLTGRKTWQEIPGQKVSLPKTEFVNPGGPLRVDAIPPSGGAPASDPEHVKVDLLDRYGLAAATMIGGNILGLGGMPNADMAAEFASAHNRWMADVWLAADPRFKGSITIAPHDIDKAVKEIETWATHPGMVQIFIPDRYGLLLGRPHFYPLYEAAQEFDLVIATHPGGAAAGTNFGAGMFAGGIPTTFFEYHVSMSQLPQSHLISLVAEGVFELFPKLKVALIEAGFAWLPHVLWSLDKDWRSFREEVPWVKRLPSEYVIEHVRVTTQPLYEPPDNRHLEMIAEIMRADQMLMFSTDYPHYDGDVPTTVWRRLSKDLRSEVMHETPRKFFRGVADEEPPTTSSPERDPA